MNAYIVLLASMAIQVCLGGLFAWSVFVPPLVSAYDFTAAQAQAIFGITVAFFALTMVFAGRLQARFGPRPVALVGGILFGVGYLVAATSGGSFTRIVLGIGVISGMGIASGYVCPLATCVRWFPRTKGFITGISVAGFGGGAIALSAFVTALFNRGYDVLEAFRIVGLTYGSIVIISSLFLSLPKEEECPEGTCMRELPVRELISQRSFWRLALGMFCGTFAGLLVVGNIKTIGLSAGISPSIATMSIWAFAVGNAAGRITWGHWSDRYGKVVVVSSLVFLCLAVLALIPASTVPIAFIVTAVVVGFGFGANFVIYAAQVAATFGAEAVGTVYPIVFLGYGLSGITGPIAGGWLYDRTGNYTASIAVAALLAATGAAVTLILGAHSRRTGATQA